MKNSNKKYYRSIYLLISLLITIISCDTNEPPIPPETEKPTLSLTLEDVSCIEAWIKLTTTNLELPAALTLKQFSADGDTISQILNLNTQDSLLYIDSLLPNKNYQYQVSSIQHQVLSNVITAATLDTTSHDFTFETFTFGGTAGSSTLYDVAIINENNIWAVGEIYVADTSQNGYTMYNAVHWDGIQWELMRIPFLFQGDSFYNPIYAVFAFGADDIWFGIGNLIHWNGMNYLSINIATLFPSLVNKIWGSSSNLYVVGNNGNIAHCNGTTWWRIESRTDLNINDIWGIADGNEGFNKYLAADNAMLKIDANNNLSRIDTQPGMFIHSVWGISNRLIYSAGEGVVLYKNCNWEKIDRIDVNTIYVIRGQNYNDVFGISSLGTILHFDGYSWNSINIPVENILLKLDVKENVIAGVGWQGEKAAITIIRRNN
jgi:hypothetical protein